MTIEFYSRLRFRREDFEIAQELKLAIKPGTGRNAAVNQVILALRYYATGTLLNLDKSSVFVSIE